MIQLLNCVFWPSDSESRVKDQRFSDSVSLPFKTRLMPFNCFFAVMLRKVYFKHGTRDRKHDDLTPGNEM